MKNGQVSFRNVRKTYGGGGYAVETLNLRVEGGEFLTLLGPSGSGKTTTLMMLAGFEDPTEGEILVDGTSVTRLLPQERNLGVVFQSYALFPRMSVEGNVGFPLKVRGRPAAEIGEKVARALDMVRLRGLGDRLPRQLSGGQQQRVALARAVVFGPRLILMDEPLGALDRQLRQEMQMEIRRLHGELGVTIVYVTHDQEEALTMSDRIAVFHHGRIRQIGSPEEIYERPSCRFVAHFVGENNALPARVKAMDGGCCIAELPSGDVMRAVAAVDFAPGTAVEICVRPERIRIGEAAVGQAVRLSARVAGLTYLGQQVRVGLTLPGGITVNAALPIDDRPDLHLSQDVAIGWSFKSARAYAGDS